MKKEVKKKMIDDKLMLKEGDRLMKDEKEWRLWKNGRGI
jgi:hypothetical protein